MKLSFQRSYDIVYKSYNLGKCMATNNSLYTAKKAKEDEFYTQLEDIEKEMVHYRDYFRGKTVLCNCDDPYESNFFKYFALNFNFLGLKKLVAVCYATSPVAYTEMQPSIFDAITQSDGEIAKRKIPYRVEITEVKDLNGDGAVDLSDVQYLLLNSKNVLIPLDYDGDFRNPKSIELLKEADVVATNPPFSLFREYVAQLIKYNKKFIIIGNVNSVTYKEVFPLIQNEQLWMGYSIHSGDREFRVPDNYPLKAAGYRVDENGIKYIRVKGVRWFTNIDYEERHEDLILFRNYSPAAYPHYDNYDAIEVSKTADIPCDYDGIMGVPITFLDVYNPDQFTIVGITKTWYGGATKTYPKQTQVDKNGDRSFVSKLNDGPALLSNEAPVGKTYYLVDDHIYIQQYARILVKRKK